MNAEVVAPRTATAVLPPLTAAFNAYSTYKLIQLLHYY